MSTHELRVELGDPRALSTSVDASLRGKLTERNRNDQNLTGTSAEYSQTTKNLYIRRKILLKSKCDWIHTTEDQKEAPDLLRFTSFLSLRFPSERSEQNQTDSHTGTQLNSNETYWKSEAVKRPADVQHPELCEKALPSYSFGESTGQASGDGNVSKAPFENEGAHHQDDHFGPEKSSHRSPDASQRSVDLPARAQTAENCSKRHSTGSDHLTELSIIGSKSATKQLGVNDPVGENAEGALSHSNLIPFGKESSAKARTTCQSSACSPTELKRPLSVPSFPAPHHCCKLETESNLISPTAPMFTSTIVSVLAPHWSGRLRKHTQAVSEVEQDLQTSGQNGNLSASRQNVQPFLLAQMKPGGEEFNNMLREPVGTSRSSAEWAKDNRSPHRKDTLQTSRPILKPIHPNQQKEESNNESSPLPQAPSSPRSPQFSGYNRFSQSEDQRESFSPQTSRPTTSSLLLSWRRLNSRKGNAVSSEMEKQLATSVSSLTLLSKNILKVSQPPFTHVSAPTKDSFAPYSLPASPEQLRSPEISPDSPRSGEMASRQSMFLSSPTRLQPQTLNAPQHCSRKILERRCSHEGSNVSVEQSITDYTTMHNSNFNSLHTTAYFSSTCISPNDNANNNVGNVISHRYPSSDAMVKKHATQATEMSPNLSTLMQSNSTYNVIYSNKVNTADTPSTSISTMAGSSYTSSKTPTSMTQTGHVIQNPKINSINLCPENVSPSPTDSVYRTFTGSLAFSPRKTAVEGTSPSHVWQNYLNSTRSLTNRSPSGSPSPISPLRPLRRVCAPSIYSYLRETSPPLSTKASPEQTSSGPQTPSLKQERDQIQKEFKNVGPLRFTFDLSPLESQDLVLIQDSCSSSAAQSLPPDVGKRSMPRLSKSPYSTLISARPALNSTLHNLSSSPVSYHHSKSTSYDGSTLPANPLNVEEPSYPSMPKDSLIPRVSGELSGSSDKQLKGETAQASSSPPDGKFIDCQTTDLIPNTTHPKQGDMIVKHTPHEGNTEKCSTPLRTLTVSKAVPEMLTNLQTHEFKGTQSANSKKNISRNIQDNIPTSAGKESSSHQEVKKETIRELKRSNRMDQVLNRLKQKFGVKRSDDDVKMRRKTEKLSQQSSDLKTSESDKKEERCQKLKSPVSSSSWITTLRKPQKPSDHKAYKISPEVDEQGRLTDENGNQFLDSPNWPEPHYINRYATMPQTRKTNLGPSPSLYSQFASKDAQNDDVFYFPAKRKTSVYKPENVPPTGSAMESQRRRLGAHLSASCADLKYGLDRGRSVSVSSVISGRPSGPGRISTGSKQGSVSDLTSPEELLTRSRHSSISSPAESPGYDPSSVPVYNTYKGCVRRSSPNERLWSPVNLENSPCSWHTEEAPTPPPSPPFSPTSRRMSQIPSSSSAGSRTSPDSLSPRGFLPSRSYKSTLSAFEESGSDTTTDDEYYLNSDDEKETEL